MLGSGVVARRLLVPPPLGVGDDTSVGRAHHLGEEGGGDVEGAVAGAAGASVTNEGTEGLAVDFDGELLVAETGVHVAGSEGNDVAVIAVDLTTRAKANAGAVVGDPGGREGGSRGRRGAGRSGLSGNDSRGARGRSLGGSGRRGSVSRSGSFGGGRGRRRVGRRGRLSGSGSRRRGGRRGSLGGAGSRGSVDRRRRRGRGLRGVDRSLLSSGGGLRGGSGSVLVSGPSGVNPHGGGLDDGLDNLGGLGDPDEITLGVLEVLVRRCGGEAEEREGDDSGGLHVCGI